MKALLPTLLPVIAACLFASACREKPAAVSTESPRPEKTPVEIDRELEYFTALSRPSADDDESRPLLFSSTVEGREISPESAERLHSGELDYMEDCYALDPLLRKEAVDDLIGKVSIPRELPAKIGKSRTIPAAELKEALEKIRKETSSPREWWEAFHRRFPEHDGILTFSRIGFSKDGMVAVFDSMSETGTLGMESGTFFAIKLTDGQWVTIASLRGTRWFS